MITRRLVSRAHRALVSRQWRRHQSDDVNLLERAIANSVKETQAVSAQFNAISPRPVQPIDLETGQKAEQGAIEVGQQKLIAEAYHKARERQRQTARLGAVLSPQYHPRDLVNNPPFPENVTLELLLASQSHLGHATSLWHPGNAQYIFGIREGIHIISLEVTAAHLRRAAKIVSSVVERGGLVLFVGTRAGQDRCVVKAAELAGGCHLFERWTPGTITNGNQLLARCRVKVIDQYDREVPGYQDQLQERPVLKPDLVVCLNPLENYVLLHECRINSIPTIGVIDTDTNPTWVTYPIPANDDSLRCIQVIAGVLGRAGQQGRAKRLALADAGELTFQPVEGLKAPTAQREQSEDEDLDVPFKFWKPEEAGKAIS